MTVFKWSQTAASNNTADNSINWSEGQSPSSINNSARAMMAAVAKWRDDMSGNLVTAGSSTAYTLTTNQTFTALTDGIMVTVRIDETSGATPTLNVDSLGAKAIQAPAGTAIGTGALVAGQVYPFVYDSGEDAWIVHGGTPFSTLSIAAGGTGSSLSDPGADRILFWDDSAGVVTWLTVNTGLAVNGTELNLSFLGLEDLTDPGADRIAFWDDSAGNLAWLTVGDGLEISTTTIQANIASQAEMETATATDIVVAPGRQQHHPGHPKAWCSWNMNGTQAIAADYGVSSITDSGGGTTTVTFDTVMSSADYAVGGLAKGGASPRAWLSFSTVTPTASAVVIGCSNNDSNNVDTAVATIIVCGDQ